MSLAASTPGPAAPMGGACGSAVPPPPPPPSVRLTGPEVDSSWRALPVVGRLALADLRHELLLTLCMVLALSAIVAPLLIVLGLKEGVVEHLRNDLVEDPVNREIRPEVTVSLGQDWFDRYGARDGVEYVVPDVLRGSSSVRIGRAGEAPEAAADLVPTAAGDPLLLENGAVAPRAGEVALSTPLARALGVDAGDSVVLRANRRAGGREQHVEVTATVNSVAGLRADALERVYAPLSLVLDVERYRIGEAIPERGWEGEIPVPPAAFDGALVVSQVPLDPMTIQGLGFRTGFANPETLDPLQFTQIFGFAAPADTHLYRVTTVAEPASEDALRQLATKLRGKPVMILPLFQPLELELELAPGPGPGSGSGSKPGPAPAPAPATSADDTATASTATSHAITPRAVTAMGYSVDPETAQRFGLPLPPWPGDLGRLSPLAQLGRLALPADRAATDPPAGEAHQATLSTSAGPLTFPIGIGQPAPGTVALLPTPLAAILRSAMTRASRYDADEDAIVATRTAFRGFRLYAVSIDDVPALVQAIEADGIPTFNKMQEIVGLQEFARGLDRIFLLVALVGLVGGAAALVASLYASVERKKADLGVMRLLGLAPLDVALFPVIQSVVITGLALALAFGALWAIGATINAALSVQLAGDPAVYLPGDLTLVVIALTLLVAVLSSIAAAMRVVAIEPAEAIHVE